jgi:hypothetical protein
VGAHALGSLEPVTAPGAPTWRGRHGLTGASSMMRSSHIAPTLKGGHAGQGKEAAELTERRHVVKGGGGGPARWRFEAAVNFGGRRGLAASPTGEIDQKDGQRWCSPRERIRGSSGFEIGKLRRWNSARKSPERRQSPTH